MWWAIVSVLLGLGFTFFSGATEAWLVDALTATSFDGQLEGVFSRGQVVTGAMILSGSVAGGYLAQLTARPEMFKIPYRGVPVGTSKRHATGRGNADKEAVVAAVRSAQHRLEARLPLGSGAGHDGLGPVGALVLAVRQPVLEVGDLVPRGWFTERPRRVR